MIDAYFLEFDFARALGYADGDASARIARDRELAASAREAGALNGAQSRVYYTKPERHELRPDLIAFTYRLEVHSGDAQFERPILVTVAQRSEGWKVISFRELREDGTAAGAEADLGVTRSPPSGARTATAAQTRSATSGLSARRHEDRHPSR